jgi:hypothetical protein
MLGHALAYSQHDRHSESEHTESMTPEDPLSGMETLEQSGMSQLII